MTTLTNNHNEQLFTELTSEEAAVVEGGRRALKSSANFDYQVTTSPFTVHKGEDVKFHSNFKPYGSIPHKGNFSAQLSRIRPGWDKRYSKQPVKIGKKGIDARWNNLPAGRYHITLSDKRGDGRLLKGPLFVFAD